MRALHLATTFMLLAAAGCGDNDDGDDTAADAPDDGDDGDTDGGDDGAACSTALDEAALDGGAFDPRFGVAGFTGFDGHAPTVYDFARDTDGSIVATGEFQYLGGTRVEPLLRYANGAWAPARATWELEPPGSGFSAVAIDATGRLALATYDDFGPRSGEIWIDDGTGLRVVGEFQGLVRRLAWHDGELWVAGALELTSGALAIDGLAVWNGTSWTPPPGGAPDGIVYELRPDGDGLLVGGAFTEIGGHDAANVARFDGTAWTALDFPEVAVYALARSGGELYAGGTFGLRFGTTGGLARWTGTAWELAAGGLGNRGIVGVATDLTEHAGSLYVAGCFHTVGGDDESPSAIVSQGIARFDGTWHALDDGTRGVLGPWIEPQACGDEGPQAVWNVSKQRLFSAGDRLLLGGSFPGVGGVVSQAIVALDGTTWTPQGPSGLGIAGSLDRVGASSSCDVWGLGQLTHVGGVATSARVLHFTGTAWEAITDDIPRDAYCPGFAVAPGGDVAVGCMIFPEAGDAIGRIYRVEGTALVPVGGDLPAVQAIAYAPDGTLWIGGGGNTGYLARLDGDAITMVEESFDAPVALVDPGADDVVVAGSFTTVDGVAAARIARWTGTAWEALGDGLPGSAMALAHDATTVYVSTYDEGAGAYLLGAFDGTAWTELGGPASGITPVSDFNFNALRVVGGSVIAAGTAELDDGSARGAFVFANGTFRPLGGGVHASTLSGLAVTSDAIWVGGTIAEAGPEGARVSTVGVARYVIAD